MPVPASSVPVSIFLSLRIRTSLLTDPYVTICCPAFKVPIAIVKVSIFHSIPAANYAGVRLLLLGGSWGDIAPCCCCCCYCCWGAGCGGEAAPCCL